MSMSKFIPELWQAALLEAKTKVHVAKAFTNSDYSGEIEKLGDVLHVNFLSDISVGDYDRVNGLGNPEQLSTIDDTLEIDQYKKFDFLVDDIDKKQSAGNFVDAAMKKAAYKMADEIDRFIFSTISTSVDEDNVIGGTTPVELTAENIYEQIVALSVLMDKTNTPRIDRKLAVGPDVYGLMLLDRHFTDAGIQAVDRFENGQVFRVLGFDIFSSNNLPAGEMIAATPDATCFAEQLVETEALRSDVYFADRIRGLDVYGARVFYPDSCAKVKYEIQ